MSIEDVQEKMEKVAQKHRLHLVVLFGSHTSGKVHVHSDIDIAYSAKKQLSLEEEGDFILDLEKVFQSHAIDLVSIHKASPLLLKEIVEGKVLYEEEKTSFDELYLYAQKTYKEAQPLFDLRRRFVRNFPSAYDVELVLWTKNFIERYREAMKGLKDN